MEMKTIRNEDCVMFNEKSIVMFSCESNLVYMCVKEIILMAGRFECSPKHCVWAMCEISGKSYIMLWVEAHFMLTVSVQSYIMLWVEAHFMLTVSAESYTMLWVCLLYTSIALEKL